MAAWHWASMHKARTLKLKQLNEIQTSLISSFAPVLVLLWHVKMFYVKLHVYSACCVGVQVLWLVRSSVLQAPALSAKSKVFFREICVAASKCPDFTVIANTQTLQAHPREVRESWGLSKVTFYWLFFCRLPESLLGLQASLDFTYLITHTPVEYGCEVVKFSMNVLNNDFITHYLNRVG